MLTYLFVSKRVNKEIHWFLICLFQTFLLQSSSLQECMNSLLGSRISPLEKEVEAIVEQLPAFF